MGSGYPMAVVTVSFFFADDTPKLCRLNPKSGQYPTSGQLGHQQVDK